MACPYALYEIAVNEDRRSYLLHRRRIRDRSNPFEDPEEKFLRMYKISKEIALYICDEVKLLLGPKRSEGLPPHIKVLICIYFMAHGTFQKEAARKTQLYVAQRTVSKILEQFCNAMMYRLLKKWIKFPATAESRNTIASDFKDNYGLPNVLGVIDCTQIAIFPPKMPIRFAYINEHNYCSINVQLIADANCNIISVDAKNPGKTNDQHIFENSTVKAEMERLYDDGKDEFILLGDSDYTLEPWLMTPILDATPNSPEERYTRWHYLVHNIVKRTIGYLRGTFRCLDIDSRLHYSPEKSTSIIITCCILYNIMKHFRVEGLDSAIIPEETPPPDDLTARPTPQSTRATVAEQRRQEIIKSYFTF